MFIKYTLHGYAVRGGSLAWGRGGGVEINKNINKTVKTQNLRRDGI